MFKDLTKEQWGEWKHNPTTKVYLQYLRDHKEGIVDSFKSAFVGGHIPTMKPEDIMKSSCFHEVLKQMEDLDYEDLETFYKMQEEQKESANDNK